MKKFKMNLFLFFIGLFLVVALLYISTNYFQKRPDNFKLASDITNIFIGDSHVQLAINNSLIENSVNLSWLSESYYYSYFKLQRYLSANKQIKRVYLGYSYHSLSAYYEDCISGKYSCPISSHYFFILPISEQLNCLKWNIRMPVIYLKKVISNVIKKEPEGYNNFVVTNYVQKDLMDERLKFQFYNNGKLHNYSSTNMYYLGKIVALCKDEKVELVLLNTPLHSYYKKNVPKAYLNKYNEIIRFYHLKEIDLSDLPLTDDCYTPDGDHVSQKGANIISREILKK